MLTVICEILVAGTVWKLQVLPGKYLLLLLAALVLVTVLLCPLLFQHVGKWQKKTGHKKQIIAYILCVIIIAGCLVGTFALAKLQQTVSAISQPNTISTVFGVYVLADDPAVTIEDASGYSIAMTDSVDPSHTHMAAEHIAAFLSGTVSVQNLESVNALLDALYSGSVQAIILNQSYADIMVEVDGYSDFFTRTKLIFEHSVVENVEPTQPDRDSRQPAASSEETEPVIVDIDPTKMPFVVYLSGSDTRSSTLVKSRSDVNILAAVNPVTKQILLVNTPRDYYVSNPAGGGEKDKLTHCGLYGIENSMESLADLYNQPVTYYAQINFTGFETLVDAVGGITVYSDVSFLAAEANFQVSRGNNYMNGKQALAFARERHHLTSGDNARGKNQMKVISAIVDKLTSSALIKNYSAILDSLQGMFVTNMSTEEISDLIKMQLDDMASWDVLSYAVTGSNGSDTNYSMPGLISYVMYPDEAMVSHASDLIGRILDGEILTEADISGT